MKSIAIAALFSALVCGQEPPPKVPPGTPAPQPPAAAPAAVAPDSVILSAGDKKITAAEFERLVASLPAQAQQAARTQPQQVVQQVFFMKRLAEMAEKDGLDQKSPYKEVLELQRAETLARAEVATHANLITASGDDDAEYYKAHPEKYRQAKVRVIYVAFNPSPEKGAAEGKKVLTETEARTKIDDLRKQLAAGGDFGRLARENSDDKGSAEKDGDFGIINSASPYPPAIKTTVFALKAGDISEVVKQPNGFYLIRVDEFSAQPLKEVEEQINQQIRQDRLNQWMAGIQSQITVKVENPAYFTPKAPLQLQPVR